MPALISTNTLILSDTHGMSFDAVQAPEQKADVAIHCGDLTDGSTLLEFHTSLELLKAIDAPLKLVIASNHDFTMDSAAFEKKVSDAWPPVEPELVLETYGANGDARQLFEQARDAGVIFLDEGTHQITLNNGALLTVYASPYTPSLGAWGFQYRPESGHKFDIRADIDIAITHGPPKGIMDYTHGRERAGCPHLFEAIAQARPLVHCFGHIHEGWGARFVTWKDRDEYGESPTHFTAIKNEESRVVEHLARLRPSQYATEADALQLKQKLERHEIERCCRSSHCSEDDLPLQKHRTTLFVNAAIAGDEGALEHRPWLVRLDLPRA